MSTSYLKSISMHKLVLLIAGLFISVFSFVVLRAAQADSSLATVEQISIVQAKKHQVKLSWEKVENADQYEIRLLDEDLTELKVVTSEKNSKTIKNLDKHTKYYVQVRGFNLANETYGEWSLEQVFYTKPYSDVSEMPIGIVDDTLPEDVRMYKNPDEAKAAGALKIAMGDLYDELLSAVKTGRTDEVTVAADNAGRQIAAPRADWLTILGDRAREQGKKNAEEAGGESGDDPHIQTFDGLKYDNQARGIFWLMKDDSNKFSVQTLQRYVEGSSNVSYNSGVSVRAGEHTITFNLKDANPVRLDGTPLNIVQDRIVVWSGVMFMRHNNQFLVITEQDQNLFLSLGDSWLNPEVIVNRTPSPRYSGLLGNENNIPYDDLSFDTTVGQIDEIGTENRSVALGTFMEDDARAFQIPMATFYDTFIEPWSVSDEESYFESNDYIDYLPPVALIRLEDFSLDEIQATRQACLTAAGLEDASSTLFNCVFDSLAAELPIDELASGMTRRDGKAEPSTWIDLQ